MDPKIAHTFATQKYTKLRAEYLQEIVEYQALEDIITKLSHVYSPEHIDQMKEDLEDRLDSITSLQRKILAQGQICSYIAGTMLSTVDTANVQ